MQIENDLRPKIHTHTHTLSYAHCALSLSCLLLLCVHAYVCVCVWQHFSTPVDLIVAAARRLAAVRVH